MSEEERRTSSLEVENICNVNDADTVPNIFLKEKRKTFISIYTPPPFFFGFFLFRFSSNTNS
jgi:hypothetical protein